MLQSQVANKETKNKSRIPRTSKYPVLQIPKTNTSLEQSCNIEIETDGRWQWTMHEYLPKPYTLALYPNGDGNCLISNPLMCTFHGNTNLDCFILRIQLNNFLLSHPNEYLSQSIPMTVTQWAHATLLRNIN